MKGVALSLVVCCLAILSAAPQRPVARDPAQEPIRVKVEAVNILVAVTDRKGRFVTDLEEDRFRVFEDGRPQQITNFSHQTDLPLRIGLLIDTSASVRPKLAFEKQAASQFVRAIMRPQDQTLLAEFDSAVTLISEFTNKPAHIVRQINGLRAGGGTAMLDAVYEVTANRMLTSDIRKSIVVVSDGADLNSRRTVEETLQLVQSAGVTIYAIGTNRFGADRDRKAEKALEQLAENSGGRAFFPHSEGQFAQAFEQIQEELRSQYSITYEPEDREKEGFRKIRIKLVKGKDLNLRYRKGYYVKPS